LTKDETFGPESNVYHHFNK